MHAITKCCGSSSLDVYMKGMSASPTIVPGDARKMRRKMSQSQHATRRPAPPHAVAPVRGGRSGAINLTYFIVVISVTNSNYQIDERRRMVALDLQCSRGMYRVHPGTLRLVVRPLPVRGCHFHRIPLPLFFLRRGRLRLTGRPLDLLNGLHIPPRWEGG